MLKLCSMSYAMGTNVPYTDNSRAPVNHKNWIYKIQFYCIMNLNYPRDLISPYCFLLRRLEALFPHLQPIPLDWNSHHADRMWSYGSLIPLAYRAFIKWWYWDVFETKMCPLWDGSVEILFLKGRGYACPLTDSTWHTILVCLKACFPFER